MQNNEYKFTPGIKLITFPVFVAAIVFLSCLYLWTSSASAQEPANTPDFPGFTVCLDPGHPSEVNDGMTVQNGVTENHINWIVVLELREVLESEGINVVLTKSEADEYVSNTERARIANDSEADLFLRIHCDSGPESASGMTFYYPDRQGEWEGNVGPPEEIIPLCERAANTIHDTAMGLLDGLINDRGVRTDNETYIGSRQGGALRGSILSEVPVVLVELCFLSNPSDTRLISDPESRTEIVNALAEGIVIFLEGSD